VKPARQALERWRAWVWSLLYRFTRRSFDLILLRLRGETARDVELPVLRHEVALRRQVPHPTFEPADRVILTSRLLPRRQPTLRWARRR
jgi:putative transposase